MRTTVTLDDDVYQAALHLSRVSGERLGKVLSSILRRGLTPPAPPARKSARRRFPTFDVPPGAPVIPASRIQRVIDDEGSSERYLLDVNVLLALAWPNHQFHAAATRELEASANRWATCALTELGFIRLSSNPAAVPTAKGPAEAASLLTAMVNDPLHVYLASLPSPVAEEFRGTFARIFGTKQVTDAYLLALARHHRATFVTFDARLKDLTRTETKVKILGV